MTKRRTTSSRCHKPTRVLSGWPNTKRTTGSPATEVQEVSLDEILESSLMLSLAELHSAHETQMAAEVEAQIRRRAELAQRKEVERLAREVEAQRVADEELEARRVASLDRRIAEAQKEGVQVALKKKRLAEEAHTKRHAEQKRKDDLQVELIRDETHRRKRTLRRMLQAAVLVSCVSAGLVGAQLTGAERSHSADLAALATEADSVVQSAELRVAALERKLGETERLTTDELKELQDSLDVARTSLAKAEEEAEGYDERKTIQPRRRVAIRKAPVSNQKSTKTLPSRHTATVTSVASSKDIYENGEKCLPHDPMCFEL